MIGRASRTLTLALPAVLAALACLAQQGCSSENVDAPPLGEGGATSRKQKVAEADRRLTNDVATVSAMVIRCSQAGATAHCAQDAALDVAKLGTRGVRTQGFDEVAATLPTKELICAIVRSIPTSTSGSGGNGAARDAGPAVGDASPPDAADAEAPVPVLSLYVSGGPLADSPGAVADQVWDLARGQAAVLVHPKGGIGALAGIAGPYAARPIGPMAELIGAYGGAFELSGLPQGVRNVRSALTATVAQVPQGPSFPALGGMTLPAKPVYAAWDAATEQLATSLAMLQPRLVMTTGGKVIQFGAIAGSGTTNQVAPAATAMLMSAADNGDFSSSAGKSALASVALSIASGLGLGIDEWCGTAGAGTGDGPVGNVAGTSTCAEGVDDARCGPGNSCAWNGERSCCRPEPTATIEEEGCLSTDDCVARHDATWICSNRRDRQFVCVKKVSCK